MKSAVILFPGLNRDRDMLAALEKITGHKPLAIWHGDAELPKVDLVVVPGGFSYGDYLRAGAIAARSPALKEVRRHADAGGLTLGVCNGFQILTEAGLLPGALMRNRDLKFLCKTIHLKAENTSSAFTTQYQNQRVVPCPIAHHDGNYTIDADGLKKLQDDDHIAFRYCDANGAVSDAANPNGSIDNIAGVLNDKGNVLGMMPHPENLIEKAHGGIEGRFIFESLVKAVA